MSKPPIMSKVFFTLMPRTLSTVATTPLTVYKGQNSEKLNFVIDKVIAMLPKPLQFFITREAVKKFVQSIFDTVKKALDYTPKKES